MKGADRSCYIEQAKSYLDTFEPKRRQPGPGKPSIGLNKVDWKRRQKLLVEGRKLKVAIKTNIQLCMQRGVYDFYSDLTIISIEKDLSMVKRQLMEVGGVPKKWVD